MLIPAATDDDDARRLVYVCFVAFECVIGYWWFRGCYCDVFFVDDDDDDGSSRPTVRSTVPVLCRL